MPKNTTAKNTYVQGRDSTAGRNHLNPELKDLDAKYENHPDRKGVNADSHDFHLGKRSKSVPVNHDAERDENGNPINQRPGQDHGAPYTLEPFNPRK